ncbi:MAG: TetR/AcrR family transcriptional regulator [Nocardioidaceae bacterium]
MTDRLIETTTPAAAQAPGSPRDRIVATAYELFARRGIRDVGIDEVIATAGVAKATLYRHFPSKTDLVLAFLAERERRWTFAVVQAGAQARAETAEGQLLAIFEVFADWFARDDYEACSFISVLLEMGPQHPAGRASIGHLATLRAMVATLAGDAGLTDPVGFAQSWHIVMNGAVIAAVEGDPHAAARAQALGRDLIDRHRP